jgi:hypothetical protein
MNYLSGNKVPNQDLRSLEKDRKFGLSNEQPVIELLKIHFCENITPSVGRYCPYDGESPTCKYEIKTRRNKYNTYPTTIITVKKMKTVGKLRFVFSFTDGLYYIEYNREQFSQFKTQDITRVGSKPNLHILIPIEYLLKI